MKNELAEIILKISLISLIYFLLFFVAFGILGKWFSKYYEKVVLQKKHSLPFYIIIFLITALAVASSNLIVDKLIK